MEEGGVEENKKRWKRQKNGKVDKEKEGNDRDSEYGTKKARRFKERL